jgi:hypothetical protein
VAHPEAGDALHAQACLLAQHVEIEFSFLGRQCLDRRIPDVDTLRREVADWEQNRNDHHAAVSWHVTTERARKKLERFYRSDGRQ